MESNFDLSTLNTLQVTCRAKYFTEVENTYQLLKLLETPEWQAEKHWVLWWGANTLFVSDFFDGIVLKIGMKGIKLLKEEGDDVYLQVAAGENRNNFVHYCIEHELGGVENMIDIPGDVGTSAIGNIGAYGQEVREVIHEVTGITLESNGVQKLSNEACEFWYRDSIFKNELRNQFIVTQIVFKLKKVTKNYPFNTGYADIEAILWENTSFSSLSPAEKLKKISETISSIRANKLPDYHVIGTAGSFFKNPEIWLVQREALQKNHPELKGRILENEEVKLSAAQLIELCWMKGNKEGKVSMSGKHALILINEGGSGEEVVAFADKIKQIVFDRFGVELEPEVIYCK